MPKVIGQSLVSTIERKDVIYKTWSVMLEKDDGVTAVCVVVIPSEPIEQITETAVNLIFYRAFGGIQNVKATLEKLMLLTGVSDCDAYVGMYAVPADPVDVALDMIEKID